MAVRHRGDLETGHLHSAAARRPATGQGTAKNRDPPGRAGTLARGGGVRQRHTGHGKGDTHPLRGRRAVHGIYRGGDPERPVRPGCQFTLVVPPPSCVSLHARGPSTKPSCLYFFGASVPMGSLLASLGISLGLLF